MRLWHKDLICVLPKKQLVSQWRECCCIAKNIAMNNTPNHILVNKIMDYPLAHFYYYSSMVIEEMWRRGYSVSKEAYTNFINNFQKMQEEGKLEKGFLELYFKLNDSDIFYNWHNERYLKQCFYNLQEKFDCNGITLAEYQLILSKVKLNLKIDV